MKNAEAFNKIKNIMDIHKNEKMVFVASALKGVTDMLVSTAENAANPEKAEKTINDIKKKHFDMINSIFNGDPGIPEKAKSFINKKMEELSTVLDQIREFGLEAYFMDYVMSFGEIMSTYLLYLFVESKGWPAVYVTGDQVIITDDNFGSCFPKWDYTKDRIRKLMVERIEDQDDKTIFCCTGFIGRNKIGYITTLGRGGSDFTATIIARNLYDLCSDKDVRVVLWKDVPGILATNPKYADDPKLITELNYAESREMAFYGAKILHPKCLVGLDKRHIPVEIRSFDNPESEKFSTISDKSGSDDITGISTIEDVALLTVASGGLVSTPGVLAKIFSIMGDNDINVSMVAQSSSEVNTTFIVEKKDGDKALNLIEDDDFFDGWAETDLRNVSILAVTGKGVNKAKIQADIFGSLAEEDIDIIATAQSSDGLNLSMVLEKQDIASAVNLINKCTKCQ